MHACTRYQCWPQLCVNNGSKLHNVGSDASWVPGAQLSRSLSLGTLDLCTYKIVLLTASQGFEPRGKVCRADVGAQMRVGACAYNAGAEANTIV